MTMAREESKRCDMCGKRSDQGYVETLASDGRVLCVKCNRCDMEQRLREFQKTGRIDGWLSVEAALQEQRGGRNERDWQYARVREAATRISGAVKIFERLVWFGGLQERVRQSKTRGLSSRPIVSSPGPITVLVYAMAGRVMITLDAPRCDISVITAEDGDESRMGVNGLHATEAEALDLLAVVMAAHVERRLELHENAEVGI